VENANGFSTGRPRSAQRVVPPIGGQRCALAPLQQGPEAGQVELPLDQRQA